MSRINKSCFELQVMKTSCRDAAGVNRHLGTGSGDVYRLSRDEGPLWAVSIGFDSGSFKNPSPFHEDLIWERSGVVAIGGGDRETLPLMD